ncbi:activator-dependent family glycosyltransferase [Allokutzneria oryzae]|uniref:Activator-dependent family glycosyltransferase n=1 Tax=Allokutzneria oryzae TaxID=1378989 RepID=A0ABV6A8A8_9PSEU
MRVLLTTVSEKSHVLTMAPLAWALTNAGHEVRVASAPAMTDTITNAGLSAVPVGTDHALHDALAQEDTVENEFSDWSEPFLDKQNWEMLLLKYQVAVGYAFQPYNDTIVDDLVSFARSWKPDLVLWDPITFAGGVAARAVGAAHARLNWCLDIYSTMREVFHQLAAQQPPEQRSDPMADWLGAQLESYGSDFHEDVVNGQWTVDQVPTSIQIPLSVKRVPVRYTPYNGRSVIPSWLNEPQERRRVLLTPGMSFGKALGSTFVPLKESFEALSELDVEVVATLSEREREAVGTFPDNARVVDFVPMHAALPTCSAVVHHGGFGTWSTAALYGVPQFILPIRMADMWIKAEQTAKVGAGLYSHPTQTTAESLREGVRRLLDESEFAEGAKNLRHGILETPTVNDIVPTLEDLTAAHRT